MLWGPSRDIAWLWDTPWPCGHTWPSWIGFCQTHQVMIWGRSRVLCHQMKAVHLGSSMNRTGEHKISKLCEQVAHLHQCFSLSSCLGCIGWEGPCWTGQKRKKLDSGMGQSICGCQQKRELWLHCSPAQEWSWKQWQGKFLQWAEFWAEDSTTYFARKVEQV